MSGLACNGNRHHIDVPTGKWGPDDVHTCACGIETWALMDTAPSAEAFHGPAIVSKIGGSDRSVQVNGGGVAHLVLGSPMLRRMRPRRWPWAWTTPTIPPAYPAPDPAQVRVAVRRAVELSTARTVGL